MLDEQLLEHIGDTCKEVASMVERLFTQIDLPGVSPDVKARIASGIVGQVIGVYDYANNMYMKAYSQVRDAHERGQQQQQQPSDE
jgi:hypothetical protein